MIRISRHMLFWLLAFILISCKSEYDQYVRKEINSGIVNDSLILGMYMGQTQKDFYSRCWQLNSEKIITHGSGNQSAKYTEPVDSLNDLTRRKEMEFYGIFDKDKVMRGMDMSYSYISWAIWNRERHADSLAVHLKDIYMQDYKGNDFISIDLKNTEFKAYVKIDGNRQILIYPVNTKDVVVKIEDLNYKLNIK